ncbi:Protein indeterminate-domain 1 [Capsicum chinense]|nr:Protein indeterminate-domain 1 [Capsicum chinense]
MNDCVGSGEVSVSSSGDQAAHCKEGGKKKRNLPGMPDPNAEVIALSPKTLLATNRFVCEICNKGFQRDQNLQLHRRGHNLPWKLRQRESNEVRKRVYVCPEPTCVHHDPSRALGDLTGIKKHFCRKHGEKKWKCDKCSKKYAVQSDLKAHLKICGTKQYKCDCGTMFSRRDSFITHRAFCDVLAKDREKAQDAVTTPISDEDHKVQAVVSSTPSPSTPPTPPPASEPPAVPSPAAPESLLPPVTPSTAVVSSDCPIQNSELVESPRTNSDGTITKQFMEETKAKSSLSGICRSSSSIGCTNSNRLASLTGICSNSSMSSSSKGSTSSSSIFPSLTGICSSTRSSSSNGSTSSISVFPSLTGVCSSNRSSSSNVSTSSISIFPSLTGICSSSRSLSSNVSTGSISIFPSLTGMSSSSRSLSSNGSTPSSSIFASSTGFCSSSSSLSCNRSTSSSSNFSSLNGIGSSSSSSNSNGSASCSSFASLFASSTDSGSLPSQAPHFTDWFQSVAPAPPPDIEPPSSMEPISLCLAMNYGSSVFGPTGQEGMQYAAAPQPAMSATALLQKAALMGATSTNSSLLRGLGILSSSSSSSGQHEWSGRQIDTDGATVAAGLGLGLPCDDGSGLKELMLGTPSVFGPKHPTLDLLGLGMAAGGGPTPGLSALITSMGGNLDVAAAAGPFDSGEFCGEELRRSS